MEVKVFGAQSEPGSEIRPGFLIKTGDQFVDMLIMVGRYQIQGFEVYCVWKHARKEGHCSTSLAFLAVAFATLAPSLSGGPGGPCTIKRLKGRQRYDKANREASYFADPLRAGSRATPELGDKAKEDQVATISDWTKLLKVKEPPREGATGKWLKCVHPSTRHCLQFPLCQ